MAKFVTFFSYTPDTWAKMMQNPPVDRLAALRAAMEPGGGQIEALYYMFGPWDGFMLFDIADAETAAAMRIGTSSTGAFSKVETHRLIAPQDLPAVLSRAVTSLENFTPPGS